MKPPHPLADLQAPWGVIEFIHPGGKACTYTSVVNTMTGTRMSYFGNNPPAVGKA